MHDDTPGYREEEPGGHSEQPIAPLNGGYTELIIAGPVQLPLNMGLRAARMADESSCVQLAELDRLAVKIFVDALNTPGLLVGT